LRFDFSHHEPVSYEQITEVERGVNAEVLRNEPVRHFETTKDEALSMGALAFFGDKYGEQVKVYTLGDFSKEVCGGPHVAHTGLLGRFHIVKEEAVGQGVRRIRATLEPVTTSPR
jgi:alanyl-tRNA synthetase